MHLIRDDLDDDDLAALENSSRTLPPASGQPGKQAAISLTAGCSHFRGGCNRCTRTVHRTIQGTVRRPACAHEKPGPVENRRQAAGAGEFFAALGPQWPLAAGQRDRCSRGSGGRLAAAEPGELCRRQLCWRPEPVRGAGIALVPWRTARTADRSDVGVPAPVVRTLRSDHPDHGRVTTDQAGARIKRPGTPIAMVSAR